MPERLLVLIPGYGDRPEPFLERAAMFDPNEQWLTVVVEPQTPSDRGPYWYNVDENGPDLVALASALRAIDALCASILIETGLSEDALVIAGFSQGGALALATIASGSLNTGTTLTLSSLSSYDYLILVLNGITWGTGSSRPTVLVNNDNTSVYIQSGSAQAGNATSTTRNLTTTSISLGFGQAQLQSSDANTYIVTLTNCKSTGFTNANVNGVYLNASSTDVSSNGQYVYKVAAAVSSLVIGTLNGYTFNGTGTYQLLGA
jgi:hypothetical protein